MINLLPPDIQEDILYARRNTRLLRWMIMIILVIVSIFAVVLVGQLYIEGSSKSYAAQVEQTRNELKVKKLDETQKKVESISDSIKLAVQVLSRQILFSSVLKQIGSAMPEGSVLTGLSINKIQGGIDLTAAARDYNTSTQVQLNLQDPNNKIFEKADIVGIQCNTGASSGSQLDTTYPCKITVRALFAKDNPFLFITNKSGSQ